MTGTEDKSSIKPSIVNGAPSDDVRVEMELDAKEIMEQFSVAVRPSVKNRILDVAKDACLVILVLVSISLAFVWKYYVHTVEQLLQASVEAAKTPTVVSQAEFARDHGMPISASLNQQLIEQGHPLANKLPIFTFND